MSIPGRLQASGKRAGAVVAKAGWRLRSALGLCCVALLAACTTPPPAAPGAADYPRADVAARSALGAAISTPLPAVTSDRARPPFDAFPPLVPLVPPVDAFKINGEATKEFERGGASWYGPRFHGRRTASGERYDMHELTAAHRTLPFGTVVRVRSLVNGNEVDVRITDRGPFGPGRVIDLSRAAAEALGMLDLGVKDVLLLVPESVTAPTTPAVAQRSVRKSRPVQRKPSRRR